jgi:NAD+ kinase
MSLAGISTEGITRLGLVIRGQITEAENLGLEVVKWCSSKGYQTLIEQRSAEALYGNNLPLGVEAVTAQGLAYRANPIISLGGDGTLIGVARYIGKENPALIGVNFGQLGFLTEIAPDELFSIIEAYFREEVSFGLRYMLLATVIRDGKPILTSQAVNEVLVQKGAKSPLLVLDFKVNGEDVMRLRADGLIISTPTGSTAYSLAAGGSIVYPTLPVSLVTPLCAHSLTNRPLVLPLEYDLSVAIPEHKGDIYLTVDGQLTVDLTSGDVVVVKRSDHLVKFVRSPRKHYFQILRDKLNWGTNGAIVKRT